MAALLEGLSGCYSPDQAGACGDCFLYLFPNSNGSTGRGLGGFGWVATKWGVGRSIQGHGKGVIIA
jgi:hypothetical protein